MDSTSYNRYSGVTPQMGTLRPRPGGRYLNPDEVIRGVKIACACAACAYVETSSEGAREKALEWMTQPAFNDNRAQREEIAEAALFVHFGDDLTSEGALLSMLLIPGQPLLIEYSPQTPGDGTHALVARCARVLGYEIVERPATEERVAPHLQHSAPRPAPVWEASANFLTKFVAWIAPADASRLRNCR